ncbi:sulfatase [bacterium]|nr:sulfatase [bacterium]
MTLKQTYCHLLVSLSCLLLISCTNQPEQALSGLTLLDISDETSLNPEKGPASTIIYAQRLGNLRVKKGTDNQTMITALEEGIDITSSNPNSGVYLPVDFSADRYGLIEIDLLWYTSANVSPTVLSTAIVAQHDLTQNPRDVPSVLLNWKTDKEPYYSEHRMCESRIQCNQTSEITVQFPLIENAAWHDQVQELSLMVRPSGQRYILKEIRILTGSQPDRPKKTILPQKRYGIGQQTRLATMVPVPFFWSNTVRLAQSATLSFGIQAYLSKNSIKPIPLRLSVMISRTSAEQALLLEHELIPKPRSNQGNWMDFSVDLDGYEHQQITLQFRINPVGFEHTSPLIQHVVCVVSQPILYTHELSHSKPNIVLISIDTLRADHLGCYGYPVSISPNIDWLSRQGSMSWAGYTPYPSTTPAHISLMTGLYPFQHQVILKNNQLDPFVPTLAEHLLQEGYVTMAVTGGGNVSSYRRIDKGFLYYDEHDQSIHSLHNTLLPWIKQYASIPFFSFYHTYEVHAPYTRYEPFIDYLHPAYQGQYYNDVSLCGIVQDFPSDRDLTYVSALYDCGIKLTDEHLGKLFMELGHVALFDRTIIVFLSDHGEHFGEHGLLDHGNSLYDPLLKVPFIITYPGQLKGGAIIPHPISILDIPATLIGLTGFEQGGTLPGTDQSAVLRGNKPSDWHYILSELHKATIEGEGYNLALTDNEGKYIRYYPDSKEFYSYYRLPSLESDQTDLEKLSDQQRSEFERLIDSQLSQSSTDPRLLSKSRKKATGETPLDPTTEEALRMLGYLE